MADFAGVCVGDTSCATTPDYLIVAADRILQNK
jgi:hypothetical protein